MNKDTKNIVIWFTGLSGAGKTTISKELVNHIDNAILLDGDNLRKGLCSDLGLSVEDRNENIRRARELAKFLFDQGLNPIVSFISPMREEREKAKEMFPEANFVEVYLSTSLEECERRDVKGLYKQFRDTMTGIGSPYEPPLNPDLTFDTCNMTVQEVVDAILLYIYD